MAKPSWGEGGSIQNYLISIVVVLGKKNSYICLFVLKLKKLVQLNRMAGIEEIGPQHRLSYLSKIQYNYTD